MTEPDREPVQTLLNVVFYAPIGAFFHGPTVVAELAEKGRAQVANAKVVGEVAVDKGRTELAEVANAVQTHVSDLLAAAARAAGAPLAGVDQTDTDAQPATTADYQSPAAPEAAAAEEMASDPTEPDGDPTEVANLEVIVDRDDGSVAEATDLPIPDYDNLSASQVVPRLEDLAEDELEAVRHYESAHRARMTILSRIAQLQAS